MQVPVHISFHNLDPSPAIEANIREHIEKLEHFFDHITSCRVVVDAPHRNKGKGKLYDVRINIEIPGHDIVVRRAKPQTHAHEDVYVSIRDAFDAAVRQLEDQVHCLRGQVKTHKNGRADGIL